MVVRGTRRACCLSSLSCCESYLFIHVLNIRSMIHVLSMNHSWHAEILQQRKKHPCVCLHWRFFAPLTCKRFGVDTTKVHLPAASLWKDDIVWLKAQNILAILKLFLGMQRICGNLSNCRYSRQPLASNFKKTFSKSKDIKRVAKQSCLEWEHKDLSHGKQESLLFGSIHHQSSSFFFPSKLLSCPKEVHCGWSTIVMFYFTAKVPPV